METYSPKLDKISENIIYLLSLDSRAPVSELSRILKQPRKVVENRVHKLYQQGLIRPLLVYNYQGLIRATIFVKLSHFDRKIIEVIRHLSPLIKLKETLGLYDLSLLVVSEAEGKIEAIVTKINELFHNSVQNMEVVYHDLEDTLGYKSFCHDLTLLRRYTMLSPQRKTALTEAEKTIVEILKATPTVTYKELVQRTSLSYKKVKEVLQALPEKGIVRFSVDPDYTALGLEFHNLLVKINLAKRAQFEENMVKNTHVHWLKRGSGRWDYVLSICARSVSEFIDITRDIKTQNKEIIFDSSALVSKINIMRKF